MMRSGQSRDRAPSTADRWRFWGLVCSAFACAWISCVLWVLSTDRGVQSLIHRSFAWTQSVNALLPASSVEPAWVWIYHLSTWTLKSDIWDSAGDQIRSASDSVSPNEYFARLAEAATSGITIAPVEPDWYSGYPVWSAIAIYHIMVVWGVRELFERRGLRRRMGLPRGHLFWARWPEFRTCVLAALLCMPLFAAWRIERGIWEASFIPTSAGAGAWQAIEMFRGALLAMLMQIALVHWLITWHIHRRSLERDDAPVETRAATPDDRCPWCDYKSDSARCPECGADRADPKAIRPRVFIPWIEKRAWLRWVFRTRTALGAIAFLFFAPVWVPAIRMGIAMLVP
jgi:hypothetical protein